MADNRPIGVMDSGLGGVSVLKELRHRLPEESFIYWADNANAPYGGKSYECIRELALSIANHLVEADVKALVVACNTATSAAVEEMRKRFVIPVISMEPAIKPALEKSNGYVLMLATEATCHLERYQRLKERLDDEHRIIDIPCKGWVECIESNLGNEDACLDLVFRTLKQYSHHKVESIVLGCTHYPLIEKQIQQVSNQFWGGACQIYDGRKGTALQLMRVLEKKQIRAEVGLQPTCILHATDETEKYALLMKKVLY